MRPRRILMQTIKRQDNHFLKNKLSDKSIYHFSKLRIDFN